MEHFESKIQDIKIHLEETAYDKNDLKNDLEVLDYCIGLHDSYNKAIDLLVKQYSSISDFEQDKRIFLEENL